MDRIRDICLLVRSQQRMAGRTAATEKQKDLRGQISPDGGWMAYTSDESGQREVSARPFPSADSKARISTAGSEQPRWRGDGKELFFVGVDGKMMAVAARVVAAAKPSFEPGVPVPLFDAHIAPSLGNLVHQYDVTADGKRFLVTTTAAGRPRHP